MQREPNWKVIFHSSNSHSTYLAGIANLRRKLGCKVYGYCLMPTHAHLIVNPGSSKGNLKIFMRELASLVGRYRSSAMSLESRFLVIPIMSDPYLLSCARYVDLNPVRARMVARPEDYDWSSYRSRIGHAACPWLDTAPCFLMGASVQEQQQRYREYVECGIQEHPLQSASNGLW